MMGTIANRGCRIADRLARRVPVFVLAVVLLPSGLFAETPAPRDLAYKQQHLRERYSELEQQLARLADLLAASDPDAAARVRAALKASREGLVLAALQEIIQSLSESRTKTAVERQGRVAEQIQRVLGLLQAQELSWEELQKQLANLQQLRDALEKLIARQQKLEQQSGEALQAAAAGKAPDKQALEKQKTEQAATRGETEKTAGETKQPGKFPPDTVDPGALPRAATHMQQAEQALGEEKPAEANAQQRQALNELQAAIGQVQQRLDQEKQREQSKLLAELKDSLKAMLEKQKTTTAATAALDKQLEPSRRAPPRELALKAGALAADEAALAGKTAAFTAKLKDDGTSAVFPEVLRRTGDLLRDTEERLKKTETGEATQEAQKRIELNFEELLESLEEEQQRRAAAEAAGGGGGGGMMRTLLLPPAAELKMLRMLQDRVNRGTRSLDEDRAGHVEKPTPQETAAAKQLGQRESEVAEATDALRKQWNEILAPQPGNLDAGPLEADPLKEFMKKMNLDEVNPLAPINKDMRGVEALLARVVTGEETQKLQTKIIRALNDLIAAAQQAQAQAMAMPAPRRQHSPAEMPEAGQQQPRGKGQPNSPASVSTLPQGAATPPGKLNKIYGGGDSDAWGRLPPAEREKFLQTLKDRFPERYQEMLAEYFKQLSTSQPPGPAR